MPKIVRPTTKVRNVMIAAAVSTPRAMAGKASFTFMSIIAAISEPVHAPVPGSGIATNRNSPQKAYF